MWSEPPALLAPGQSDACGIARWKDTVQTDVSQRLLHLPKEPKDALDSHLGIDAKPALPGPRFGTDRVLLRLNCVAEILEELPVFGSSAHLGYSEQLGKANALRRDVP